MTMEIDACPAAAGRRRMDAMRTLLPWCVGVALVAVAVWLRHIVSANTDVSWLLTVGERVLDGQHLYRDVIETNPPKAVLIYMPGIVLARGLGLSAEAVTDGLVFVAIVMSLGCAARLLKGSAVIAGIAAGPLLLLALAVLAILPMREFGQREHIAILELLPAVAVLALRLKRETPPAWGIAIAGIGLGLALAFKPHFAIAIVGVLLVQVVTLKSWRVLVAPEYRIAAGVVAAYGALVVLAFPDYLTIVGPLARDVYVTTGLSVAEMLQKPVVLPFAIAMLAAAGLMRHRASDPVFTLLIAMATGFAIVFAVQRKGWSYHAYPMMVFAVLALGHAVARSRTGRASTMGVSALAIVLLLALPAFNAAFDATPLKTVVARFGPNPRILAITAEPGLGHPLVRELGGTWVSRQQGLWVAGYAAYRRKRGELDSGRAMLLDNYASRERDWLIADIRSTPPSVVLVDNLTGDWGAWVAADATLTALLAPYVRRQTLNGIDVLSRAE